MRKVSFTDCIELVGEAPKKYKGEKKYVSTGAVNCNEIDQTQIESVSFDSKPSRANLVAEEGDVLFAKMQNTHKVLLVSSDLQENIYSTGFCAVRARKHYLTTECLFYLLNSPQFLSQKDKFCSGATQRAITNESLTKINITLPELNEQAGIVQRLDYIEDLIKKRKKQIEKIDLLVKSKFIEMFGDFDLGTHKYGTQRLGQLSYKISDGVHAKPEYIKQGKPFISVQNINRGVIDFENCKFVSEEAYQKIIKSSHPNKGDILYTKVGATYGIPAYVNTEKDFCLYVSVCLIKPNPNLINPRFLSVSMGMRYVKKQADERIKGIGVPDLHLNQIREFEIIVPPFDIQNYFVAFIEQIDKAKLKVKQSLEKLETLRKALMQKYFG